MTLYEFKLLDEAGQNRVIWDGVYLGVRIEDSNMVQLYSLGTFYVEVFYSPTSNTILWVSSFKSIGPLQPYIDQITLDI